MKKIENNWGSEIQSIFRKEHINGGPFWSRKDGDIHAPAGFSTIDVLGVLGELGAGIDKYSTIKTAVEFIFSYQNLNGSFCYSRKSSKLPCMAGRIIAALKRVGIENDLRVENCYQWLLKTQDFDGGWRCATVKLGKSSITDASNPGATLYVLDAFRFRKNNSKNIKCLNHAVDFLLKHWETRIPLGPCEFGIGSRFFKVEYPFLRYNLFYYVYVLSYYKKSHKDFRFLEAFKELSKHLDNGEMIVDTPHRKWQSYSFAYKGKTSKMATKRFQEIKSNLKT